MLVSPYTFYRLCTRCEQKTCLYLTNFTHAETLTFFTCFLVLAHRKEREEKTPTPEVSNCGLIPDNNLDPVSSLDAIAVSALRRRNVSVISNPCVASAMNDNTADSIPTFFDLSVGVNLEVKASRDSRIKYPKLTASYPKIPPNPEKIHPRDIRRSSRHIDAAFSKPPCSQPPVFLKCKKKILSEGKVDDQPDDRISSQTTDLDIQFSKLKLESLVMLDSSAAKVAKKVRDATSANAQTLKQYCNFEEKKVMRVAPHIRRKDVICDTVDAWSCDNAMSNTCESSRYKPLVFGGTYPIDSPLRFRNNQTAEAGRAEGRSVFSAKKNISLTYDIDVPTKCE